MFTWMTAMLLGIFCASFLPVSAGLLELLPEWLLVLLMGALFYQVAFFKAPGFAMRATAFFTGLALGVLVDLYHAQLTHQSLLRPAHEQEMTEIEGFIVGLPRVEYRYGKRVQQFEIEVLRTRWKISESPLRRVKLSWRTVERLEAGQHWRLRGKLKRPRGFANPGGMDYQLYLHQQGIDATGYIRWGEQIHEFQQWRPPWHGVLSRVREQLGINLASATKSLANERFIRALAIGDGAALSPADWQVLNRTGTTHLFVISGLHIGMLAAISYFLALQVFRCVLSAFPAVNATSWAAGVSLMCAGGYSALAGFSLPTQRAVFMLLLLVLARQAGRRFGLANALLLAALMLAILQPLSVRSPGYSLSFIAVAALLFVHAHRLAASNSRPGAAVKVQWVCALALSVPLLIFFQASTWVMPLVNLLVVPIVGAAVVPMVLLVLVLTSLSLPAPPFIMVPLDWLLHWVWRLLEYGAEFSSQQAMFFASPSALQSVAALVGVVFLLAPTAFRRPLWILLPLCAVPWLSHTSLSAREATPANCPLARFTVLDVGQGLAAVFTAQNYTLVFDTGARFSETFDAGSGAIVPYLRNRGRTSIDDLIVSHGDLDHSGGLPSLQEAMPITRLITGYEVTGSTHQRCIAGMRWQWQAIEFEFLSPGIGASYQQSQENNASCVLLISAPGFRILLPGDIEAEAEQELLQRAASKLHADILVMPHHGSSSSSSAPFADAVGAKYAIASAAYKGRFNHPHKVVLDRYTKAGTKVLNTAHSGAIEFELPSCNRRFSSRPSLYRHKWGNYWLAW